MSAAKPPFSKILVANRGEIAIRVFRTCREHGIRTVAVYSDGDSDSPHVAAADEAVHIGPTPSAQSYLVAEKIIAAAKQTGADAIHPGYGFLSERASFVEACDAAGITFIGPGTEAMNVMGDKVRARKAMIAAEVPLVPGREDLEGVDDALAAAAEIGYPLMLKASAGGGGKGMRIVHDEAQLRRGFEAAQREALAAFGDGRLFVERAVMKARHVEIQLMADRHGTVVYLNERDCSVQRRHQKVIEEAPSPSPQMTPEVRAAMGEVACRVARSVNYVGAATVEFLFEEQDDGEPRFYFLEMNTRLQVEHPVTEMTTGRDLVWDMIRVAAGEPLGYGQGEVGLVGHAVECRIYAEDSLRFLPSPGPLLRLRWPEGPNLRIDAAVREGSEVSSHYDPMIAKLVAWGPDRAVAIERMRRALEDTVILGIDCNIDFHLKVLAEEDFRAGHFDTGYIGKHPALTEASELGEAESAAIAAAAALAVVDAGPGGRGRADSQGGEAGFSSWQRSARWMR
ncbi:Acetyl-/propionyl-coenzyme A carboxylase alpha chain [Plesiocystis pacifica SIR-1]|uniref:Acetyl-/propionyl-coenzyme A carboxylase alpha chain n=1 Tax=Plesiocystis pacifica SIR-1 TaxID=391625 RepID=A6G448_9BACT|nr:acetyl-CoA carboxylase biotin carboxylase subunit [Plesiocystis pacifica]EDM79371.1 Acetyl-/propionyl-coenzyme A carboxylase alpha chain [Plesiocystis pacifica SIR-1]